MQEVIKGLGKEWGIGRSLILEVMCQNMDKTEWLGEIRFCNNFELKFFSRFIKKISLIF